MTSLLNAINFLGFDNDDYWSIIPQFLAFIALLWFGSQTLLVFYREAKTAQSKSQGGVPVLGFLYAVFSAVYIYRFILNFGALRSFNELHLRNSLSLCDNPYWYVLFINLLTALILIGFTLNFSKAFLTLTFLEFGRLGDQELSTFLNADSNGNKTTTRPYVEATLRLVIVLSFIFTEKHLAGEGIFQTIDPNIKDRYFNRFLLVQGILSLVLYASLLLWLSTFRFWFDKDRKLSADYRSFYKQFFAGIVVGAFFLLFGWEKIPADLYKILVAVFLFAGIAAAFTIVLTIISNERKRLIAQ